MTDAQFNSGEMKYLKWTDWFLTMCNTIPSGYSRADFKQPRGSEYFHRQDLDSILNPIALRTAKTPKSFGSSGCNRVKMNAFCEFGVKLPRCKTIIPVCLKTCWNTKGDKGILTRHILRNKKICLEVDRLMRNNCKLYARGASVRRTGKNTELAISNIKSQLKTIDYAWSRHGNGGHRKLIRNKIIVSDDTL